MARGHPALSFCPREALPGRVAPRPIRPYDIRSLSRVLRVTVPPHGTPPSRALPPTDLEELLIRADRARLLESLTRGMAHDLRGSLQTLALLADPGDHLSTGEGAKLRAAVVGAINNLTEAVQRFGTVFGPSPAELAPVIVDEVVGEVVKTQRYQRGLPSVGIEVRSVGNTIPVKAAESELRHALLALITNAKEALNLESAEGRVVITIQNRPEGVELSVCDNGPGFASEMAGRASEPFATTRQGHLGIGLAAVRALVSRWEGRVTVGAGSDGGACVTLDLVPWEI